MQDFRKLRVWERGQALAVDVRRTTHRFPKAGYGALRNQMTRAAESIVFTIVEGTGAIAPREFARFLEIAIKSASELEAQLELARNYGVLDAKDWRRLSEGVVSVRRMLVVLRRRVLAGTRPSLRQPADRPPTEPTDPQLTPRPVDADSTASD